VKFTIKDKELSINPATLRQIHQLESQVGNIEKLTADQPFDTIVRMMTIILEHNPQQDIDMNWILDNCSMAELKTLNEAVAYFLGANAQE
jgi:hypothetical protein|tara:strand:- start:440 stop:709 length:270 start_codon:yes stop_codon:yes gene_type:complete